MAPTLRPAVAMRPVGVRTDVALHDEVGFVGLAMVPGSSPIATLIGLDRAAAEFVDEGGEQAQVHFV